MRFKALILDLDGFIYKGRQEVPGAGQFVSKLKENSIPYVFLTNRANRSAEEIAGIIGGFNCPCEPENVVTAAQAAAITLVDEGAKSVHVFGSDALRDEFIELGVDVYSETPSHVVVGVNREIKTEEVDQALRHILNGAQLVSTNPDLLSFNETGPCYANGFFVAGFEASTGVTARVMGKPFIPIVDLALKRLGVEKEGVAIAGDNLRTDILAAKNSGLTSILSLTGVSTRQDCEKLNIHPDHVVENFEELSSLVF